MYFYLKQHPQIFLPSRKEPHYFNARQPDTPGEERRYLAAKMIDEEEVYLKLFRRARSDQVVGEASVSYLADDRAPLRIMTANPKAKIVILLRHPVERAYSGYLMGVREGREENSSFLAALEEDFDHMCRFGGAGSVYIWPSLYHEQVKRYLDGFGTEQVGIYLSEEFNSDTARTLECICQLLGVPYEDGRFFDTTKKYHRYGEPRGALLRSLLGSLSLQTWLSHLLPMDLLYQLREHIVDSGRPKPPLEPEAREYLGGMFRNDVVNLQDLIGKDLSHWLD